jgi:crotonobetainyl-CoA:carnitine CoA-transferase CaiB-like acyl-CoA transferase
MKARARQLRAGDLVDELQRRRISAEVVTPLRSLITSPQWRARKLMRSVAGSGGRTEAALGPPFTISGTAYCAVRPSLVLRRGQQAQQDLRLAG